MGIFFEDTINIVESNINISASEAIDIIIESNELISEIMNVTIDMINESALCLESEYISKELKVKKEDLTDPQKVKEILKSIEKETNETKKVTILNSLFTFFMTTVAIVPGTIIIGTTVTMVIALFVELASILNIIITMLNSCKSGIDKVKYKAKIKRGIDKLNKAIEKESDPKYKKVLEDQLKILKRNI